MSLLQALRTQTRRVAVALWSTAGKMQGQHNGSPAHPTASSQIDASAIWRAKVDASRKTEALEKEIAPRLPAELRPYLRRLLMRDAYPSNLQELLELSVAYRSNLDRLFLHDCAPMAEYEDAKAFGPAFEAALSLLRRPDANQLAVGASRGDASPHPEA
jgi:hypothetical protein